MRIEPFRAWHLPAIDPLHLRAGSAGTATLEYGRFCETSGPAFSAIDGDRVIASAGIIVGSPHGNWLWSYLRQDSRKHFVAFHRATARFLDTYRMPLLAGTEMAYQPGCRWLEMLGFKRGEPLSDLYPAEVGSWVYRRGM